jgi:L-rhamnose isomerase/sugar isomerase
MIQPVTVAQELYSKAALVDRQALAAAQARSDIIQAEALLQDAFSTDVRPAIREWRVSKDLPADPLQAFRDSGPSPRL